jgi:hypothetical protein
MKNAIIFSAVCICAASAYAKGGGHSASPYSSGTHSTAAHSGNSVGSHSVHGYTKRDGTYVAPAHATNPDGTKANNWTAKGNVNPYTGKPGTKED